MQRSEANRTSNEYTYRISCSGQRHEQVESMNTQMVAIQKKFHWKALESYQSSRKEQFGSCQRQRVGKMGEGGQKVQTSSYKISHGDVRYSMVAAVNNTVLHI